MGPKLASMRTPLAHSDLVGWVKSKTQKKEKGRGYYRRRSNFQF